MLHMAPRLGTYKLYELLVPLLRKYISDYVN